MSEPSPPLPPEPQPAPRTGRLLGGVMLVLLGFAWLLEALDVAEVPWDLLLPAALIAVGVILFVNARTGASQGGMIALGVVLTVLLFLGSAVDFPIAGGVGDRSVHPATLEQAADGFELGIGKLTVDLTSLPASDHTLAEPTVVKARVGIGQLLVIVPEGVPVRVNGKASLGSVRIFDRESGGIDVDVTTEPEGGGAPVLDLRLSVGLGEVRVERG
jgi:hypothetical protein